MIAFYKFLAFQRLVAATTKEKFFQFFYLSRNENCFAKAGISKDQQKSARSDDDDPFKDLQSHIEKLGDFYPVGTTAKDVNSGDKNAMITVHLLKKVMNAANADDADDEENDDDGTVLDPVCPKVTDVRGEVQVLHDYMPLSTGEDIQQKLNALSISIDRNFTA